MHDAQLNPSVAYSALKDSCKIANGLGISVVLAAVFTAIGVVMHANLQTRASLTTAGAPGSNDPFRADVI